MRASHLGAFVAAALIASAAAAQTPAPAAAPAAPAAMAAPAPVKTVADAMKAKDDTKVVLEGLIVKKFDNAHYEFKDATGTVKIDIDKNAMPAKGLDVNTKVRLNGEVDAKKSGVEIEVKKVEVL
jgi:uncharacterized protein (TIGR00156 family)